MTFTRTWSRAVLSVGAVVALGALAVAASPRPTDPDAAPRLAPTPTGATWLDGRPWSRRRSSRLRPSSPRPGPEE